MQYKCYTGGAIGADTIFEIESIKKGFDVIAYSFKDHNTTSEHKFILSEYQLKEGYEHIKKANLKLNRNIINISKYVKNLLSRDWFQVKSSDAIYAIGILETESIVCGGTGYAIQLAIDEKKPIYFFDQSVNYWHYYDYDTNKFEIFEDIPTLTHKFAGIGTRKINNNGINAIKNLIKKAP
jgi:hypothetical protein